MVAGERFIRRLGLPPLSRRFLCGSGAHPPIRGWRNDVTLSGWDHLHHPSAHPGATDDPQRHAWSPSIASASPPPRFACAWYEQQESGAPFQDCCFRVTGAGSRGWDPRARPCSCGGNTCRSSSLLLFRIALPAHVSARGFQRLLPAQMSPRPRSASVAGEAQRDLAICDAASPDEDRGCCPQQLVGCKHLACS